VHDTCIPLYQHSVGLKSPVLHKATDQASVMKDLTVDTDGFPVSHLNLIIIALLTLVLISKAMKNPNVGLADVSTRHFTSVWRAW
jgi:hypothetical protein